MPASRRFAVRVLAEARPAADRIVELADEQVSLVDVLTALDLNPQPACILVDGEPMSAAALAAPAGDLLRPGSTIVATDSPRRVLPAEATKRSRDAGGTPVVEVAVVGGFDAGVTTQLPIGRYRMGGGAAGDWYLAVDRPHLASTDSTPWHEAGAGVEAVDGPGLTVALSRPIDAQPQHVGYVHRPPRRLAADAVAPITLAEPPRAVNDPAPLSWATLLGPIPIAIIMAIFFRPIFAVFAAIGPIVALGRWFEARRRHRRDLARRADEVDRLRGELAAAIAERTEAEARRRWQHQPHVAELWKRAREHSSRLWEVRPGTPGHLCFTVGHGPDRIELECEGARRDPEIHGALDADARLRTVPHTVDLATGPGVGFHGDRNGAVAMARAALLQLATLHGPADLRIGALLRNEQAACWDWLKWLPHSCSDLTSTDPHDITEALGGSGPPPVTVAFRPDRELGRAVLLLVDDPGADVAAVVRAAAAAEVDLRVMAIAPSPTMLPAVCSTLVEAGRIGARVSTPHLAAGTTVVQPVGISDSTAGAWARSLAPMLDPELLDLEVGEGDEGIGLLGLVDVDGAASLVSRWQSRPAAGSALVPVGTAGRGAFTIDLDNDGPHALVAGTTGSGKSEFLRTLVLSLAATCPPDEINFVLVDFKGGGAFDVCADLPHVAGLITDLDQQLVERAINSLRAELHRRELLFRRLGVSAWHDAVRVADEPVPRLVIVIDEFAALATDYGDLLTSIIDLAARGRSLGMHLVLATQRPSGVIDQKIRANTNLRVALRVQDAFDSHDVIGVPDAAAIDRRKPGRAIFSIGGDTPVSVQTAYTGGADRQAARCRVRPFELQTGADVPTRAVEMPGATIEPGHPDEVTELATLTRTIIEAAERAGQVARPLWPDPLPETFDWIDLGARLLHPDAGGDGLALGLVDLPDQQAQLPWRWDPDRGALALYGASATTAGRLLVSMGAAIASTAAPDDAHLYVLDGDAGACAPLAGLPHTGAYVRAPEVDRVDRVIAHVEWVLAQRRLDSDPGAPRIVVMIDNVAGLLSGRDEMQALELVERLSALARDGAPQRVHLVVTARTPRDLSHRLAQQIPTRLAADLADPAGFLTLGLKGSQVVDLPDMRVIDLATHRIVQLVAPPDLGDLAPTAVVDPERAPVAIRSFPSRLSAEQLVPATIDAAGLRIPVGVDDARVEPVELCLRPGEHALVVGPPDSGRTSFLGLVAHQLQGTGVSVRTVVPGGSASRGGALTGSPVDAAELRALAAADEPVVVLVDDADHLVGELSDAITELGGETHRNLHLVVAATAEHVRGLRANTAGIRSGGIGVLLGGLGTDGDIFKLKRPKLAGLGHITGRGHLVHRGRATGVQVAAVAASSASIGT